MNQESLKTSIKSIDTRSLADRVEMNLIELFNNKNFKAGDSIPTEMELVDALQVSRTVVREALLRLRMMGMIETKKKKGAVITNPDLASILQKSMNPKILDDDTLREVFEMRLSLEIGMADFLFNRVTKEDIKDLRKIVRTEPPQTQYHLFNIGQEIAFHGRLYEITRNETLKNFQKMLLPVFDYVHHSGLLKKQPMLKQFISHNELVDILENGTPEKFRNGMRMHLENHFARLFE